MTTVKTDLIRISGKKIEFLKSEYTFVELVKMEIFGSKTTIWRRTNAMHEDGRQKKPFEILKFDDRSPLGSKIRKIVFRREYLESFIAKNKFESKYS